MGGLTGYLIIGAAIVVFGVINNRASRRIRRTTFDQNNQWIIDPQTGQRVPAPPGQQTGQPHGRHPGGGFGGHGGHHGGGFGGGGGGHHGGGSSGGGGGGGGGGHHG